MKLDPSFEAAANAGAVEAQLGRFRDAAQHLSYALLWLPDDVPTGKKDALVGLLAKMRAHVGALRIVGGSEPGVSITVDGRAVSLFAGGSEVFVEPGEHQVRATRPGYVDAVKHVSIAAGEERDIRFHLAPSPPASMPAPQATQAPPAIDMAEGGKSTALIVTGVSAATLGLVLGVVFTNAANTRSSTGQEIRDYLAAVEPNKPDSQCRQPSPEVAETCATLRSTVEDRDTFTDAARWGFAAGGTLLIATAAYMLWPESTASPAAMRTVPGFGRAAVQVAGSW